MRIASMAAALGLAAAVTAAAARIDATPASVELTLWCFRFPNTVCRHQAADMARMRCGAVGANARFVRSALVRRTFTHGQEGYFLYDCVR